MFDAHARLSAKSHRKYTATRMRDRKHACAYAYSLLDACTHTASTRAQQWFDQLRFSSSASVRRFRSGGERKT